MGSRLDMVPLLEALPADGLAVQGGSEGRAAYGVRHSWAVVRMRRQALRRHCIVPPWHGGVVTT